MLHRIPLLSAALALLACTGVGSTPAEADMKVSTDRAGLQRHITVPDGLDTVQWAARARGTPGLGPTDLELVAHFPLSEADWGGLAAQLGPAGGAADLSVPPALLQAIERAAPAAGASLPCAPYENMQWRCVGALRQPDGVLVYLVSR